MIFSHCIVLRFTYRVNRFVRLANTLSDGDVMEFECKCL